MDVLFFDAFKAPSSRVPRSMASQVDDGRSQPTKAVVYPTYDDPFELIGLTGRIVNNHGRISSTRHPTLLSISLADPTLYRCVAPVSLATDRTNNDWLCH